MMTLFMSELTPLPCREPVKSALTTVEVFSLKANIYPG